MPLRTHNAPSTSTMLNRKGMRQPQLKTVRQLSSYWSMKPVRLKAVNLLRSQLVHRYCKGFLFSGALSTESNAAPPHSPPTANPWMARSVTSKIGAHHPMVENEGRIPIKAVAMPIIQTVSINMRLRPSRSPKWPKMTPPSGRKRNPTPKVANAASVPIAGLTCGKNSRLNTSAAVMP